MAKEEEQPKESKKRRVIESGLLGFRDQGFRF